MTELDWLDSFSENLRELMDEKGYTQRELAEATGLSNSAIYYYVTGERIPGVKAIINIAYELDVDVADFIDFGDRID